MEKDKQVLLVRLGDKEKNWIPSEEHFNAFMGLVKHSGLDKKYNIIVSHFGIDILFVDPENIKKIDDLVITDFKDLEKLESPLKISKPKDIDDN